MFAGLRSPTRYETVFLLIFLALVGVNLLTVV
jgi:hypothetical protein